MSPRRTPTVADCRRALWLLGAQPPLDHAGVLKAWRARVAQSHPDRHVGDERREQAAATLTRALNEARETLDWWIDEDLDWPAPGAGGVREVRFDEPEPWPEREPAEAVAPVCPLTGLRRGDQVRLRPYDGDLLVVEGTEVDQRDRSVWVRLVDHPAARADRPADFDLTVTCSYPFVNWLLRARRRGGRPAHVFVTQNGDWPAQRVNAEYRWFDCDGLVCTNPEYFERHRAAWPCT